MNGFKGPVGLLARAAMALLMAWGVALAGCDSSNKARDAFVAKLEGNIRSASQSGGVVRMADVTEFAWDTLHVFPPYTPVENVHKALGFEWADASDLSFDNVTQLVFVKDGKVVMHLLFPREKGDFADLGKERFTPSDARFRLKQPRGTMQLVVDAP